MFYWFTFEDGYATCVKGMSKNEMVHEVLKHGKLISKEPA